LGNKGVFTMKIVHRVGFSHRSNVRPILDELGVKYQTQDLPGVAAALIYFDIAESDPRWAEVGRLIQTKGASDIFNTTFSTEEILEAEWIRLIPMYERDYPQPEEGWERITYETKCPKCGAGYRQKAPFRLAKEPRLGKHDFFSLYWTYTLFCTLRVVESLRAHHIRGYQVWEAILHQTNLPSTIVSQLVFPNVAEPGLADVDKLRPETCAECGITKYAPHLRGYMHLERDALHFDTDAQLTYEWFGSGGHTGFREILISNRLARLILEQRWRGVALKPIEIT
jgi:hypothetical protein